MLSGHETLSWLLSVPGVGPGAALKWRPTAENVGMTLSQNASQHQLQGQQPVGQGKKGRRTWWEGAREPNAEIFAWGWQHPGNRVMPTKSRAVDVQESLPGCFLLTASPRFASAPPGDARPSHRTDSFAAEPRHRVRPLAAKPAARCDARWQKGRLQEAGGKVLALLSPPGVGRWVLAPLPVV